MGSGHSRSEDKKSVGPGDGSSAHTRKFKSYHLPFQKKKKFSQLKARLFGKKKSKVEGSPNARNTTSSGKPCLLETPVLSKSSGISTSLQELSNSAGPRSNILSAAHSQHIYTCSSDSLKGNPAHCEPGGMSPSDNPEKTVRPMLSPDLQCSNAVNVSSCTENRSLEIDTALFRKNEDPYSVVIRDKSRISETVNVSRKDSSSSNSLFEDAMEGDLPCKVVVESPDSRVKLDKQPITSTLHFDDAADCDATHEDMLYTRGYGQQMHHANKLADNALLPTDKKYERPDNSIGPEAPEEETDDVFFDLNGFATNNNMERNLPESSNLKPEKENNHLSGHNRSSAPGNEAPSSKSTVCALEDKATGPTADDKLSQLSADSESPQLAVQSRKRPKTSFSHIAGKPPESDSSDEVSGSVGDEGRAFVSSESDLASDPVLVEGAGNGKDPNDQAREASLEEDMEFEIADITEAGKDQPMRMTTEDSSVTEDISAICPPKATEISSFTENLLMPSVDPISQSTENSPQEFEGADIINAIANPEEADTVAHPLESAIEHNLLVSGSGLLTLEEINCLELQRTEDFVRKCATDSQIDLSEHREVPVSLHEVKCDASESSSGEQKASVSMATSDSSGSDIADDIWDEDFPNEKSAEAIKTKLVLDLLRKLEVDMGDFHTFTELPGTLDDKYHVLPLREFLTTNLESKFGLDDLSRCLRVLAKYGLNLLKAEGEEGQHWRKVIIPPKAIQGHWLCIQGSKDILMELGYEESNRSLVYPEDCTPNVETTAAWVVEMLLAAHEINVYCMGSHPQPEALKSIVDAEGSNVETVCDAMAKSSSPPPLIEESPEHGMGNVDLGTEEDEEHSVPDLFAAHIPDDEHGDDQPITTDDKETDPCNKDDDEAVSDMFGRRTVVPWLMDKEKRLPESPFPQRCHLCGSSSPAVRCEKCSNLIFCMSCDDMYHRHPKRRDHARKAVNAVVASPPPLPPPRPPSKITDPSKVPVPPPRRRKSQRSIPNSPVFGRKAAEQKPDLPKKQFPNLKFGSLKRFIPGNNSSRPPPSNTKGHYQQGLDRQDCSNDTGAFLIDSKYGVGPERLQERYCGYQDRPPVTNYPRDNFLPREPAKSNAPEQSSSDAEEECFAPSNRSPGSGSYVGSGPRDEQWSPSGTGPPFPPPYGGRTSRSIASLNHQGAYPEPGCRNSTLNRRNTMMSGTMERNLGYGYPRYMQHSSSVCDLSPSPYMAGYRLPQVQSMADLQQVEIGALAAPCGCRPNWIGPDAFDQWHPPVICMAHSGNMNVMAGGMKPQQPPFHQGFASPEGVFGAMAPPIMYPIMPPSGLPVSYPMSPANSQGTHFTAVNGEQRAASPAASAASMGSRKNAKEAIKQSQMQRHRPRPPPGATSSEEDYFSAGESDEDQQFENSVNKRHNKTARHKKVSNGSWECEHCTFVNKSDTRICNVCCKTTGRVKAENRGIARKNSKTSVEPETVEFEGDAQRKHSVQSSRADEKLSKSRYKNASCQDDGEYEDLENGSENEKKIFPKDLHGEQKNIPARSSEVNPGRNPSAGSIRRGVEVATDPMESADSLTINRTESDTQTYSSVIREKIRPASNSLSSTNGSTTGQKQVMSQGTSPPPQSISTQTPHADVWSSREPQKSMGRTSSRISLAGDTADLIGGAVYHPASSHLKRATSLHFPQSYTGGFNDGCSNWGVGYQGRSMVRSGSRSSLMSDHQFGCSLSSGPPSRESSPPPHMKSNIISRRESNIERGQAMFPSIAHAVAQEDQNTRIESRKDYYLSLEELVEKRRQETLKTQGLQLVKMLRDAEQQNFSADDLQVAINHCGSQNPVQWLQDNWKNMVDTVVTLATNYGNDKKKNDIGIISSAEAKEALRLHKGNIWAAVTECVEQRQKRFAEIQTRGSFSRDAVVAALTSSQGNVELACEELNKASLKPFLMRIWGPPSGVENESAMTWAAMQAIQKIQRAQLDADDLTAHMPSHGCEENDVKVEMLESFSNEADSSQEDGLDSVTADLLDDYPDTLEGMAEKSEAKEEEFFDAVPGTPSEEQYDMSFVKAQVEESSAFKEKDAAKAASLEEALPSPTKGQSSVILTSSATITLSPTTPPTSRAPESALNKTTVTSIQVNLEPVMKQAEFVTEPVLASEILKEDSFSGPDDVLSPATESLSANEVPMTRPTVDDVEQVSPSKIIPQVNTDIAATCNSTIFLKEIAPTLDTANRQNIFPKVNGVRSRVDEGVADNQHSTNSAEHVSILSTDLQICKTPPEESIKIRHVQEVSSKTTKSVENSQPCNDNVETKPISTVFESDVSRRVRQYLAEGKLPTYQKAEVAIKLIDLRFDECEAIYAARECSDLYMAVSYLQQDCELCAGKFPMGKMISMLNCIHRCCRSCAKDYFTLKIKERNIMEVVCPYCNEPNLNDDEIAVDYFNNLDIILKNLVEEDIHELFQRKLRDRALMSDPNFLWCHKCASGFIAEPNRRRLVCPNCKVITCAECKKPWEKQHDGISCQQFMDWKRENDPEYQIVGLEKYLAENGIDCPKCKFKYSLAKGGCMHFTCSQCKFEFCSGCGRPFRMAKKCGVSERCERLGLHAHHPRNCLFYLRDKEPEDLLKLLNDHGVKYDIDIECVEEDEKHLKKCPVVEQKELPDGVEDSKCGREVEAEYPGLCRIHYIEYLGGLLYKNKLDPIALLSEDNLESLIRDSGRRLPTRPFHIRTEEHRQNMIKLILKEIPLEEA